MAEGKGSSLDQWTEIIESQGMLCGGCMDRMPKGTKGFRFNFGTKEEPFYHTFHSKTCAKVYIKDQIIMHQSAVKMFEGKLKLLEEK